MCGASRFSSRSVCLHTNDAANETRIGLIVAMLYESIVAQINYARKLGMNGGSTKRPYRRPGNQLEIDSLLQPGTKTTGSRKEPGPVPVGRGRDAGTTTTWAVPGAWHR